MNDLATIIKMNKPLAVKIAQTAARRANTMSGAPVASGRLPVTQPKKAATRAYLAKQKAA